MMAVDLPHFQAPFYSDTNSHAYDLHIYVQKKHISGLLLFKGEESMTRFSIVTKTGQKLFDATLNKGEMQVQYIMDQLDRKLVRKQLARDLNLLVLSCSAGLDNIYYRKAVPYGLSYRVSSCSNGASYAHFEFEKSNERLIRVGTGNKNRLKEWATFEYDDSSFPHRITIDHRSIINLRLELTQLTLRD